MEKKIVREAGEYDVFVNGQYIGSRRTYAEAENLGNETVYRMLQSTRLLRWRDTPGNNAGEWTDQD